MKAVLLWICFIVLQLPGKTQLTNGGIYANFGIDGDTRAGYNKYGQSQGIASGDDWFYPVSNGFSIIDTSNASFYKSLLITGNNIAFTKRMNAPLYSKLGNTLWLDGVYSRDYIAVNSFMDSTGFTIASKNGDNPANWVGGTTSTPNKNDLIDVFAHMRRDGLNVHDSLWLFTAVSTIGTNGSRYFDVELYKKSLGYNSVNGQFSTSGTDAGHTQWLFDAAGNIIQTGDLILAVNFTPGAPPVVDVRIWVSQSTFSTVNPFYFSFGPNFDGTTPSFGYASIVSKSGSTAFGSGISNYSLTPTQDTTTATPWGTGGALSWSSQFQSLQYVEIGLNLTRIGIDPSLYSALGLNPCQSLFASIFFKSRSSNSFVSNMQDFVGPLDFLTFPAMDYGVATDTLKCNKPSGVLTINNNTTAGYYTWTTTNGNITGTSTYGNTASINKPGTYIVSSAPAAGCAITRRDTIVVPIDTFPPIATMKITLAIDQLHLQLTGGDTAASNYMTPFGRSQGLLWNWSGPDSFSSTIQNPLSNVVGGRYQLIVTEKRNGCKDTVFQNFALFMLASSNLQLTGASTNNGVQLNWSVLKGIQFTSFEIEKGTTGSNFTTLKSINAGTDYSIDQSSFSFLDIHPYSPYNYYRVKAITANGEFYYSDIIIIRAGSGNSKLHIFKTNGNNEITIQSSVSEKAVLAVYSTGGSLIFNKNIQLEAGNNSVPTQLYSWKNKELLIVVITGSEKTVQPLIY
jgi:hypothetical protein